MEFAYLTYFVVGLVYDSLITFYYLAINDRRAIVAASWSFFITTVGTLILYELIPSAEFRGRLLSYAFGCGVGTYLAIKHEQMFKDWYGKLTSPLFIQRTPSNRKEMDMCQINPTQHYCKCCNSDEPCRVCENEYGGVMKSVNTFEEFKSTILNELIEYEYKVRENERSVKELTDTIARLTVKKAELEAKVEELSDVVAKLTVQRDEKKSVIHG